VAFQTRARTIDHLGREQIADCPTAISELWKNAYDAYATSVELNIFDGDEPTAAMTDDGHGMNRDEFISRWLVVGTDSKVSMGSVPIADMNGLRLRPKQGQKGIGRLSSANLGPLLLLISKRSESPFLAALVDWRLFENPYLNLSDIEVPLIEFGEKTELFSLLPAMFNSLLGNVKGDPSTARGSRVHQAWEQYDAIWREQLAHKSQDKFPPSQRIASTIIRSVFEEKHLRQWAVWNGKSPHGTAMLVSQLNFDLKILLKPHEMDAAARGARERFFETLSSFVDPFLDSLRPNVSGVDPQFHYEVRTWIGDTPRIEVGKGKEFNRTMVEAMEHMLDGFINIRGEFKGRVKAFGKWQDNEVVIRPPDDLIIPEGFDSLLGPLDIFIAAMEFDQKNSTHPPLEHKHFKDLAEKYSGFLVFRDGLRVLPYGREDNDFFEIEMRRSKHAGREFWNQRQMFGRIAISRNTNPNLKDKAGREGLLDNRAAKTLKVLISNILMQSARQFFGTASTIRTELLPTINETNKKEKARENRNALRRKQRRNFQSNLKQFRSEMPSVLANLRELTRRGTPVNEAELDEISQKLADVKESRAKFRLGEVPDQLGPLDTPFKEFRADMQRSSEMIAAVEGTLQLAISELSLDNPTAAAEKQLARNSGQISRRIRSWKNKIEELQRKEFERIRGLMEQRSKLYGAEMLPLLGRLSSGDLNLQEVFSLFEAHRQKIDEENENLFSPYISALESMGESIDLESVASFGIDEASELRLEIDRLNGLAQLGITVEIIGHDLEDYDQIISAAITRLPETVRSHEAFSDIQFGVDGLTDQLRFLSPLKLSGNRRQDWVTGGEIWSYVNNFFELMMSRAGIDFSATDAFRRFRVFDQPSRLFPVFINLINNARYWVTFQKDGQKRILLTVVDNKIVVSDSGPGIAPEDIESLFTLFFTRKARGGRGVGLYLCRANLAAGGHTISYSRTTDRMPLPGANFVIDFRGAEYHGG
jgi:signal transduction histidine kinase